MPRRRRRAHDVILYKGKKLPAATWEALLPQHKAKLTASGITPEIAEERGYRSVTDPGLLATLGFKRYQCRVPTLLIPLCGVDGGWSSYQHRPDDPRFDNGGKPVKYENMPGRGVSLDIHRPCGRT